MSQFRGAYPKYTRSLLCATAAVVGLFGGHRAIAQPDAATPSATGGLEEIVVTARRREERVQSIPLAITVLSGQKIEENHITQVKDLIRVVPSLSTTRVTSDANSPSSGNLRLRGLPGTTTYFADVPVGSADFNPLTQLNHGSGAGLYYDLDNVEVIKGPQGTLFGKNSIGGLVSLSPKKPGNAFDGYLQATVGNNSDREFEGAVDVPVVADKLLIRVAGQTQQRDGYTKVVSTGKDLDSRDSYAWRVGVVFRPTDDLENYLVYDGYYQHSSGSSTILKYINPGVTFATVAGLPLTLGNGPAISGLSNPATAAATFAAGLRAGAFSFFPTVRDVLAQQQALGPRAVAGLSNPAMGKDYDYGITDTLKWDLTDDLTIKNIAAVRFFKTLATLNDFGAPLPVLFFGDATNPTGWQDNSAQFTEEFQLQGKALSDKLTWILGGFLEYDGPLGDMVNPVTALGTPTYTHVHASARSQAVFAHGIYDFDDYVPGLRLTAGYRYTWDFVSVQRGRRKASIRSHEMPMGLLQIARSSDMIGIAPLDRMGTSVPSAGT